MASKKKATKKRSKRDEKPKPKRKAGPPPASDEPKVSPGDPTPDDAEEPTRRGPGRPPKRPEDRAGVWKGVRLLPSEWEAVLVIAKREKCSPSDAIRAAIRHFANPSQV